MDRPTCKLCLRRFPNGRALGGHMRSHVASTSAATKQHQQTTKPRRSQATSPTSSSSSGRHLPSAAVKIHVPASYRLRKNPRKSSKLADPEFSNPDVVYDDDLHGCYYSSYYYDDHQQDDHQHFASSAVVQDVESETESSMAAAAGVGEAAIASKTVILSSRRRSKRRRRGDGIRVLFPAGPATGAEAGGNKLHDDEQAPVSSVSDATPDEEVALCLVMLSRDAWSVKDEEEHPHREIAAAGGGGGGGAQDEEEASYDEFVYGEEDDAQIGAAAAGSKRGRGRGGFRCGTCNKSFRSYQALGGHRASHKKARPWNAAHAGDDDEEEDDHYFHKQFPGVNRIWKEKEGGGGEEEEADDDDYSEATGLAAAPGADPRIHQCPICFRVFASGQALGGHKRSHGTHSSPHHWSYVPRPPPPIKQDAEPGSGGNAHNDISAATPQNTNSRKKGGSFREQFGESYLDLNLPAPADELDAVESAISIASSLS